MKPTLPVPRRSLAADPPAAGPFAGRVTVRRAWRGAGLAAGVAAAASLAWGLASWLSPQVSAALSAGAVSLAVLGPWGMRAMRRPPQPAPAPLPLPVAAPEPEPGPSTLPPDLDPVTGLATQERFLEMFDREWARSRRYGVGAALAVIELDRMPLLEQSSGESTLEAALVALARELRASLRAGDFTGRHGPSSLIVFLAHADPIGAVDAVERIRDHLEQLEVRADGRVLRLTASAGVAMLRPSHLDAYTLIADAEAALQAAQADGGNCVRAAPVALSPGARAARSR